MSERLLENGRIGDHVWRVYVNERLELTNSIGWDVAVEGVEVATGFVFNRGETEGKKIAKRCASAIGRILTLRASVLTGDA